VNAVDARRGAPSEPAPGRRTQGLSRCGGPHCWTNVKPRGSLYGMVARDEQLMDAVRDVAELYGVPVHCMSGCQHETVTARQGVPSVGGFCVDL